jgi:hypothetical protein
VKGLAAADWATATLGTQSVNAANAEPIKMLRILIEEKFVR